MSVVIPSLRGAIAVPGWAKNELWRRARAVPSLDLRFADNKSLTDAVTGASLVTFTRSSNGTFVDSAGVLQTAATDVPRFDHNPTTGESLGLLVEEQRTNSIRNNTMVGAVAGTPGTLPTNWTTAGTTNGVVINVVGTGTENGIAYIDLQWVGTATATSQASVLFDGTTNMVAAPATAYTGSLYVRRVAGSNAGVDFVTNTLIARNAGGANIGGIGVNFTASIGAASLAANRQPNTFTTPALTAFIQHDVRISFTNGAVMDFTLRIGLPQLEQGAFATSPILTSTSAVTRNADVTSITGSAFSGWYRQDEGTVFASAVISGATTETGIAGVTNAGETDFLRVSRLQTTSRPRSLVFDDSAAQADTQPTNAITIGQAFKLATALKQNDFSTVLDGGAAAVDTSGTMPTVDRMTIGTGAFLTQLNGRLARLTYFPARLSNASLQTLTQ